MGNLELRKDNSGRGEIVIYQPDDITRLDVRVENESVLLMLSKRQTGVTAEIRTGRLTETLKQDLAKELFAFSKISVPIDL